MLPSGMNRFALIGASYKTAGTEKLGQLALPKGQVEDRLAAYIQPQEKENFLAALQQAEDWLYTEEGEDAKKSDYVERLDKLHAIGVPVSNRYLEAENRPRAISELRNTINTFQSQAQSEDERWSHIDAKDKQAVIEKAAAAQKWLGDNIAKQAEKPKNVPPVFTCEEVRKKTEELTYFATPIFNKPKPKPKVDTPQPGATPQPSGRGTPNPNANPPPPPPTGTRTPQPEGAPASGTPEMEID